MKTIFSLLMMAISLIACSQTTKPMSNDNAMVSTETLQKNKTVATRYFEEVINLKKIELIKNDFTNDMEIKEGKEVSRIKTQEDWVKYVFSAVPDINYAIKSVVAEGNTVVVKANLTGTQKGEFLGYKPLGNKIDIIEVFFFTMENGKIKSYTGHSDMYTMSYQLTAK
jgi:predicted ester cyclase